MSTPIQVWNYRTLIGNLAQRDLKSRYKKSVLGWLWSLINPAVTLAIYTVVFGVFLRAEPPVAGNGTTSSFALFLFCALVAWNFFSGTINTLIGNFQAAGGLLTRTYFPPECPMIAGLMTTGLQALLETAILLVFMVIVGNASWTFLISLPVLVLLALFSYGLGLIVGLGNVRFRDVGYLVGIALQVVFYATPIVYPITIVPEGWQALLRVNPLTHFADGMRDAFYLHTMPTAVNWLMMGGSAVISLVVGWWVFSVNAPKVIEEL
ncbi:MAG: ABC transporter permease [Microthrixaceae bacterium]|nr:ABC transporter permease [Microthrixaceae bacterium]MCO5318150.1 ABC transporter permease [Microthrixaceae bacterium]